MSAILKFDFQKRKQLRFSEVNYLNYTKRPNFACDNFIFPKTRETRTNSVPVPHPLRSLRDSSSNFNHTPNNKQSIFVLYAKLKNSCHLFG